MEWRDFCVTASRVPFLVLGRQGATGRGSLFQSCECFVMLQGMTEPSRALAQDRPPGNGKAKVQAPQDGMKTERQAPRRCARYLDFDAAHRLVNHASKCRNLHGHRYRVRVLCEGPLDDIGVVIDFGEIKGRIGTWLDAHWDHGAILNREDAALIAWCRDENSKVYVLDCNPTAENLAAHLLGIARKLLGDVQGLRVVSVRIHETPNCYAEER